MSRRRRQPEPAVAVPAARPAPARARRWRWREALPVAAICALALGLRLWGIGWGLPIGQDISSYHPDEAVNLVNGVLDRGVARPHIDLAFYNYGGLYFYLWQIAVAVNQAYGLIAVQAGASLQPGGPATLTVGSLLLVGRLLSAFSGAAACWAIFAAGRRLFSRHAGLVAAGLWAVAPAAVVHGHFATVDVTASLVVAVALAWSARVLRGGWRDVALAGLFAGLAAAARYNCGLVVCAPIAAVALARGRRVPRGPGIAAVIACAAAGFALGCPGALVNSSRFVSDLAFEAAKSREGMGALFAQTGSGFVYHIIVSMRYGLAMPLLLLTVGAVGHAIARRDRGSLVLLAFVVPYYAVIGIAQVRYLRYILPMMPALMLLAGRTLTLPTTYRTGVSRALSGAGAVVFLITLLISGALARLMAGPDAREEARAFIATTLPAGRSIAFATTPFYCTPRLAPEFGAPVPGAVRRRMVLAANTPWTLRLPAEDAEWDLAVLAPPEPDCVVVSDFETEDPERLGDAREAQWMRAVRDRYAPRVFENVPSILGLPLGKPAWLPNDWLYICPRVTVYLKK